MDHHSKQLLKWRVDVMLPFIGTGSNTQHILLRNGLCRSEKHLKSFLPLDGVIASRAIISIIIIVSGFDRQVDMKINKWDN